MGRTYVKKVLTDHLKFKLNWVSYILIGNSAQGWPRWVQLDASRGVGCDTRVDP